MFTGRAWSPRARWVLVPLLVMGSMTVPPGTPDAVAGTVPDTRSAGSVGEQRLPTGDRVSWQDIGGGQLAIDVNPAARDDGTAPGFVGMGGPGDFYVYPLDAVPGIAAGTYDRRDFRLGHGAMAVTDAAPDEASTAETAGHRVAIEVFNRAGQHAGAYTPLVYAVHDDADVANGDTAYEEIEVIDGAATARLPTGVYTFMAWAVDTDTDSGPREQLSLLIATEVHVDGDTTVVLDAREAVKPTVDVPRAAEQRAHSVGLTRRYPAEAKLPSIIMLGITDAGFGQFADMDMYVTPSPPGRLGFTAAHIQWSLAQPQPHHETSVITPDTTNPITYEHTPMPAYVYNLPFDYPNGIPADLHHTVTDTDLVAAPTAFHADKPDDTLLIHGFAGAPPYPTAFSTQKFITQPGAHTVEFFRATDTITWRKAAALWMPVATGSGEATEPAPHPNAEFGQIDFDYFPALQAGTRRTDTERWFAAPIRTGAADYDILLRQAPWPPSQTAFLARGGPDGNEFLPGIHAMDNTPGHRVAPLVHPATDSQRTARPQHYAEWAMRNLTTGEVLAGDWKYNAWPVFHLDDQQADYELTAIDKYPTHPNLTGRLFDTKPVAATTWTFTSAPSTQSIADGYDCDAFWAPGHPDPTRICQYQPLIQLRYNLDVDTSNTAPACTHTFTIDAGHHSQAVNPAPVTDLTVEASYDDGATWHQAATNPASDNTDVNSTVAQLYQVTITHPAAAQTPLDGCTLPARPDTGYVALRVRAEDAGGGTITQTISRAYKIT